jgi:hypothetical protein
MNKKSYRNKRLERLDAQFNLNLPSQSSGEEGLSGDTASGGGRGYAMPGESVMPAMHSDEEDREEFPKEQRRTHSLDYDKLTEVLIGLSDEMDKESSFEYANFTDFLIKKIAEQKALNPQILLKDLLIKINNSDIIGKQTLIKTIVREYNSLLIESVEDGDEEERAHEDAYHTVAQMVINHV